MSHGVQCSCEQCTGRRGPPAFYTPAQGVPTTDVRAAALEEAAALVDAADDGADLTELAASIRALSTTTRRG